MSEIIEEVQFKLPGYENFRSIFKTHSTHIFRPQKQPENDGDTPIGVVVKKVSREGGAEKIATLEYEAKTLMKFKGLKHLPVLVEQKNMGEFSILVMEDCGGKSLRSLNESKSLGMKDIIDIAIQVCQALGDSHSLDVTHKDINPDNIVWNPKNRYAELIDFGISSHISRESQQIDVSTRFAGSPAYISPEQGGRMNRNLDYRSDFYSLGVTLYELLAGRLPFHADKLINWIYQHMTVVPKPAIKHNTAIPPFVSELIMKLIEKEPELRYQSAYGLGHDLKLVKELLLKDKKIDVDVGSQDVPAKFTIPEKLYGREYEVEKLVGEFGKIKDGGVSFVVVKGVSGIGKSAIVNEIYKPVTRENAMFVTGKFEQFGEKQSYAALSEIFQAAIKNIMHMPEETLQEYVQRLKMACGNSGQILVELAPKLENLIGKQPPLEKLDDKDTLDRKLMVLEMSFGALSTPECPLVIFLDDLQWADQSTLLVLEKLACSSVEHNTLIIGAFRSNEVDEEHILHATLETIKESIEFPVIDVDFLDRYHTSRIVADTLFSNINDCRDLSQIVFEKTQGNPFFINQLLFGLFRDGMINYDNSQGKWTYNIQSISEQEIAANIVLYLTKKLIALDLGVQETLRYAACSGGKFDIEMLEAITGKSYQQLIDDIEVALQQGIVSPSSYDYRLAYKLGGSQEYRFQHDKLQEACYLLMEQNDRTKTHLSIAKLLYERADKEHLEDDIIDIVRHYNLALPLINDQQEIQLLIELNSIAGAKAKNASAFDDAYHYYKQIIALRNAEDWDNNYATYFADELCYLDLCYLTSRIEEAEKFGTILKQKARTNVDKAKVLLIICNERGMKNQNDSCIDAGLEGLNLLGVKINKNQNIVGFLVRCANVFWHLRKRKAEDLLQEEINEDDEENELTSRFGCAMSTSTHEVNRYMDFSTRLEGLLVALKRGVSPASSGTFAYFAAALNSCGLLNLGAELTKFTENFLIKHKDKLVAKGQSCAYSVNLSANHHWLNHLKDTDKAIEGANRHMLGLGEQKHYAFMVCVQASHDFVYKPLKTVATKARISKGFSKKYPACYNLNLLLLALCDTLKNKNGSRFLLVDEATDDELFRVCKAKPRTLKEWVVYCYWGYKQLLCLLYGDWELGVKYHRKGSPYLMQAKGNYIELMVTVIGFVLLARELPRLSYLKRIDYKSDMNVLYSRVCSWEKQFPLNFTHLKYFMEAEFALYKKDISLAHQKYAAAIEAVEKADYPLWEAIINEFCGRMYVEHGNHRIARIFIFRAKNLFGYLEHNAKVKHIEEFYAETLNYGAFSYEEQAVSRRSSSTNIGTKTIGSPSTVVGSGTVTGSGTVMGSSTMMGSGTMVGSKTIGNNRTQVKTQTVSTVTLDMDMASQAARNLAGEVNLESLMRSMLDLLKSSSSANHILFMLKEDEKWVLQGELVDDEIFVMQNEPLEKRAGKYSEGAFRLAEREMLMQNIGNVAESNFKDEKYVQEFNPKSLFVVPVINQQRLIAMLYLENNVITNAFTADKIQLLEMISAQAAISIENALLYANLEAKVEERTHELYEKNQEIQTILDNIQQGIFAMEFNEEAEVSTILPGYSKQIVDIFESDDLAGKELMELLEEYTDISSNDIGMAACAVEASIGFGYSSYEANKNNFLREATINANNTKKYVEIDWSPIKDEKGGIYRMLATVKDVTELKAKEKEQQEREAELQKLMQILNAGITEVKKVIKREKERMLICDNIVKSDILTSDNLSEVFRHLHTTKGSFRGLGIKHINDEIHVQENGLADLKTTIGDTLTDDEKDIVIDAVRKCNLIIQQLEVTILYMIGETNESQDTGGQLGSNIKHIVQAHRDNPQVDLSAFYEKVLWAVDNENSVVFKDLMDKITSNLSEMAQAVDKPRPHINIKGEDNLIPEKPAELLSDVFVHCVRNSLDHGIEAPAVRIEKGKIESGTINIDLNIQGNVISCEIFDDGAGLNLAALASKALKDNSSDEELAELIFASGVSTAEKVSDISGRGVGMDAVRSFLQENNGSVDLVFTDERNNDFRAFKLVVKLPIENKSGG